MSWDLPAHALLAEEVADLHRLSGDGHVDGEMGVTEAHLVQVTLGDTRDHVLHVRADGADARKLVGFVCGEEGGGPRHTGGAEGGVVGGAYSARNLVLRQPTRT